MRKHILALASSVAIALLGSGLEAGAQMGPGSGGWHDHEGGGYGRDWRDQRGGGYGSRWHDEQSGRYGRGRGDDGGGVGNRRGPGREFGRDQRGGGMMGRGMMSRDMMGRGGGGGSGMAGAGMMGPAMMRMMLTLMDTDGDGTVSLTEFQAAHERMFKAMDADKDGRLTLREVQAFFQDQGGIMAPEYRTGATRGGQPGRATQHHIDATGQQTADRAWSTRPG